MSKYNELILALDKSHLDYLPIPQVGVVITFTLGFAVDNLPSVMLCIDLIGAEAKAFSTDTCDVVFVWFPEEK